MSHYALLPNPARTRSCNNSTAAWLAITGWSLLTLGSTASAVDMTANPFGKSPRLHGPPAAEVKQQLQAWMDQRQIEPTLKSQVDALWSSAGDPVGCQLLETLVAAFALVDERAAKLVALTAQTKAPATIVDQAWLRDPMASAFETANLRLYYGRWLTQHALYEESREQLAGLAPEQVADPATLLFYQAVNAHRLLARDEALKAIRLLLDDVAGPPERYTTLATLMEADLKALKEESLDHVARRMQDIERRLDLGRPGPKTREVEDGVIASLDKLIKELEQQQQQQASSSGGSNAPQMPAPDSRILGGSGRGETTKRELGDGSGWGNLPPKERQDALQQIGKDFPSHYRDAVEQYFRRLATERRQQPGD